MEVFTMALLLTNDDGAPRCVFEKLGDDENCGVRRSRRGEGDAGPARPARMLPVRDAVASDLVQHDQAAPIERRHSMPDLPAARCSSCCAPPSTTSCS